MSEGAEPMPRSRYRADRRVLVARDQQVGEPARHVLPVLVVRVPPAAGSLDDAGGVGARHAHAQTVDQDEEVARQRAFAVGDGALDDPGHACVALELGRGTRVGGDDPHARLQPGDGRELHVLLAERRQHLLDVAEEHRAGPDQQHALIREAAPVRVEQIGGAVQGDRGLPGARSAPDDQHAVHVGADRFVLFGLDRGDDVAHAPGAVPLQGREQRALARDPEPFVLDRFLVEHLVVEGGDFAALAGDEVAAPDHRHRLDRGGPVEGLGDGGAPVDDEGGVGVVLHGQAPDVPAHTPLEVEPAEHQGRLADLELGQPALGHVPGDVPLQAGLVGPARAHVGVRGPDPFGGRAHRLEPRIGRRHIGLLGRQLRVRLGVCLVLQIAPLESSERDFRMGQLSRWGRAPGSGPGPAS